ncbi:MAG: 30S ribosomal protein S12 methylthiotransferase RimO [Candidatus Omnitrophica bacterium]|nr:30S ribosomal protein S12 methylthiotransferase RimO [Candidatus Omnitrophota bacterium]
MSPTLNAKSNAQSLRPVRIGMLSLGCPKTLVDSEVILGKLDPKHHVITPSVTDCDVALLNTCAFIHDAQQESVDRILELVELKKERRIKAVIVMGCLVQRFSKELQKELEEVDAFIGSGEYAKIPEIVERVSDGKKVFSLGKPGYLYTSGESRVALTPSHYRYLKISEGCDHVCTFCTIPSFRGKHRSRTIEDIVSEAERLVAEGAKEIILTGQDTTYFGRDQGGHYQLPELLQALDQIPNLEWIRLLYAYPSCITQEMMKVIRDSKHICHYLDMPLQHASDPMLEAMRRGITKRRTRDLIHEFRKLVPDLAIRTTFIVGFPGETDRDFSELLEFMKEMQFERLGIFKYSQEEGTPAAKMAGQVPEKIKQERFERAMLLQQEISDENNQRMLGKTIEVLVEARDTQNSGLWIGRSWMDAPEVDGNVLIHSKKPLQIGSFYPVPITSTAEYDLVGKI